MWDYSQVADPGAVGAGKTWYNTGTGDIKYRNSSNSQWTFAGNSDVSNLGLVPGVTGFASSDAHDFPTSVKKGGIELATTSDLAAIQAALMTSMSDKVVEGLSSTLNSLRVADYVAVKATTVNIADAHADNYGFTLTKPTYANGRTPSDSECTSIIAFTKIVWKSGQTESDWILTKKTELTYELRTISGTGTNLGWSAQVIGIVIAVRPQ